MKITEGCASMALDGRVATTAVSGLVFEVRRRVADAAAPDGRFMTLAVDGRVMTLALDGRFMTVGFTVFGSALTTIQLVIDTVDIVCLS